jgi:hypothetical protein
MFLRIFISFAKGCERFVTNQPTHRIDSEAIPKFAPFAVLLVACGLAGHAERRPIAKDRLTIGVLRAFGTGVDVLIVLWWYALHGWQVFAVLG